MSVYLKKMKGSMFSILPILFGMIAISALSLMYLSYISDYEKKEAANQLSREYILRMETEGYMTDISKNEFINSLENLGFKSINLSGTTFSDVGYGQTIILNVNAVLESDSFEINNLLNLIHKKEERKLYICKMSTAKN